jgi:transposase-like protein
VVDRTLFNWVKAHRAGKLTGVDTKAVSAEQMEIRQVVEHIEVGIVRVPRLTAARVPPQARLKTGLPVT